MKITQLNEHKMAKGTIFLMIANLIFLVCSFIIHFGLGRLFGPELYGTMGVVFSLLAINGIVIQAGIPIAVSKYTAENEKIAYIIKKKAVKIQLVFSFAVFILYFSFAPIIANLLNDMEITPYLRLSSIVIPFDALFWVQMYSLNGLRKFGKQTTIGILYNIVKVILVFLFVFLGFSLIGAIIGYTLASVTGLLVSMSFCKIERSKDVFTSSKLIKFAVPIIIFSIAIAILMSIDLLLIKALINNDTYTGHYTSANFLSKIPYYIFLGLSASLLPSLSKSIAKKNSKQTRDYINSSLRYMLLLLLPVVCIISATSEELINLVYGNEYIFGARSLSILIFGLTFLSFFAIFTTIITANNKPLKSMIFAIMLIPIDVVLNIYLIPIYGLNGAAIATSATMLIGLVVTASYIYKQFRTLIQPLSFIRICISSIIIYLLSIIFSFSGISIIGWYIALLTVYISLLWLFKEIKKEDFELIKYLYTNTFNRNM